MNSTDLVVRCEFFRSYDKEFYTFMPKIDVSAFHLPQLRLLGAAYKKDPLDKLFWVDFAFLEEEFPLEELALLDNGRLLQVRNLLKISGAPLAFQFKGVPEKTMTQGRRLYDAAWPIQFERKAYFVPLGAQNKRPQGDKFRLRCELIDPLGILVTLKWVEGPGGKALAAVSAEKPFPCLIGLGYTLESERKEVLEVALLTSGAVESRDLADYVAKVFRYPGLPSVNALYSVNLRVNGWVILPPPLKNEEFEDSEVSGNVRIMQKALGHFAKKMRNACAQPGGMDRESAKERMALPLPVFEMLAQRLVDDGVLRKKGNWYLPVGDPKEYLSPLAKSLLERLEAAGMSGIDISIEKNEVLKKTLTDLVRMDLAVQTESPWVYANSAWASLRRSLCGRGTLGKAWKIAEVKEQLQCSRKPLLGILNLLESEGYVEWREDCRVVIRETEDQ
jgi:hypothetical protein